MMLLLYVGSFLAGMAIASLILWAHWEKVKERQRREDVARCRLRESQRHLRMLLAGLLVERGEILTVDDRTLMLLPQEPEILSWRDPGERKSYIALAKGRVG